MEKVKLTDILEEDYTKDVNITNDTSMYDPLYEDGADQEGTLKYTTTIDGRRYKVSFDVNKNPTKKGIKVKFFPLDDSGKEIESPSPEQLAQLQNDVATKLAPKFNDFRLEFDEDEDAPEKNVAAFQVPLSSFVSFVANVVFKK
ncbi:hypothetical protein OAE25_00765 [Verrucomicrobiales bacterium]|jgi:hypothetical protein|nr:hypothetical protein [Verrucomicrobiales bacterium]